MHDACGLGSQEHGSLEAVLTIEANKQRLFLGMLVGQVPKLPFTPRRRHGLMTDLLEPDLLVDGNLFSARQVGHGRLTRRQIDTYIL